MAVKEDKEDEFLEPALTASSQAGAKPARGSDSAQDLLPAMEHFVRLVRKVQHPELIRSLIEYAHGSELTAIRAVFIKNHVGSLPIVARNRVFTAVAALDAAAQLSMESAAERISLLCDPYGTLAVNELITDSDILGDRPAQLLKDKFSKAQFLFLCQEAPHYSASKEPRFDHAEARRLMLRQALSEKHSSHYLGPKDVAPQDCALTQESLKRRLAEIFPAIRAQDIIVERFVHRDLHAPDQPVVLYTLNAAFNGSHVYYQQVADGEVRDCDEPAVTNVSYSWEPEKAALVVYCEDVKVRSELAAVFRDIVLCGSDNGCDSDSADVQAMPVRQFDLMGFCAPSMLNRFKKDRIAGIESIAIQNIVVAKPETRSHVAQGRTLQRRVENSLAIRLHRYEDRDFYTVCSNVHGFDDLSDYAVLQVKLAMRIAKTTLRKAHSVAVQITTPNGFNNRSMTKADTELVFAQLMRLGCARQY
jgi:hypothetical protein